MDLFRSQEKKQNYFKIYDEVLSKIDVPYTEIYVKTDYGNTHIIHSGNKDSKKLLMLHCMGFSSICWHGNLKELSEHFDIYCVDIIGEPNKTESSTTKIMYDDYMKWLIQIFDGLNIKKANIVGWSFGGFIATGFAINHPERIEKAAVLSPASTVSKITKTFYFKLFPALISGKDNRINNFIKWIGGNNNDDYSNPAFSVFAEGLKSFQGWATGTKLKMYSDDEFKNIKVPYYLILGERDPIYKKNIVPKVVVKLNSINQNIKAESVDYAHGFPIQQVELVNKKLISFFE